MSILMHSPKLEKSQFEKKNNENIDDHREHTIEWENHGKSTDFIVDCVLILMLYWIYIYLVH
jgi:hypothetical protein